MLGFDATGFPKQGKTSVGVERQDSETVGKVGNCQVAVPFCDSDPQETWPVAVRLYLPKTWAYDIDVGGRSACQQRACSTPSRRSR
jgi:SRSO17 transposase